ncbi:casein kinase II subunit alpha'-like isoform X2 [Myxocyprinus asiaticus]|uniref:casein kinase II subunit alpha'-like isoform X2 n=1 Tax=Myxocyprinus asiaticus TaxID=70543 RepID=UPI0022220A4B|nr:casein kinase II subunit alpha'-like isoform X2 [Myxocyprinus asiaticus]
MRLNPAVKATIITGMCEGLLHLHCKDIVHQDLKPDNIMVEHQTHRAVIIDLGLAKFSRNGLTSAVNMGNEAYSAPEILQMNGVRDKRSDVWAMGKIIAELCARVRLPTQFVSASKIRETLKDQPYCIPVSRMVEVNPNYRSTMAAVISDIRRAGSPSQMDMRPRDVTVTHTNEVRGNQKWCPQVPAPPKMEVKNSPMVIYRQDPPHQREVVKVSVPLKGEALNNQLSLMSFPCHLPETGKVTQERYNEEKGALEYKEIITKGGRIIKYEKVQITKDS